MSYSELSFDTVNLEMVSDPVGAGLTPVQMLKLQLSLCSDQAPVSHGFHDPSSGSVCLLELTELRQHFTYT